MGTVSEQDAVVTRGECQLFQRYSKAEHGSLACVHVRLARQLLLGSAIREPKRGPFASQARMVDPQ